MGNNPYNQAMGHNTYSHNLAQSRPVSVPNSGHNQHQYPKIMETNYENHPARDSNIMGGDNVTIEQINLGTRNQQNRKNCPPNYASSILGAIDKLRIIEEQENHLRQQIMELRAIIFQLRPS